MTTVTEDKILKGLQNDDADIERKMSQSISALMPLAETVKEMAAYLFTYAGDPNAIGDPEYVADVVTRFNAQMNQLDAVVVELDKVRGLADPDPAVAASNLAALILDGGYDPATFVNRYK